MAPKAPLRLPANTMREFGVTSTDPTQQFEVVRGVSLGAGVDAYPGDTVLLPKRIGLAWSRVGRIRPVGSAADLENGDEDLEHAPAGLTTRSAGGRRTRNANE